MTCGRAYLDSEFPIAAKEGYDVTSCATKTYNCIGWALGDDSNNWGPVLGYKWRGEYTLAARSLVALFESEGYERCNSSRLERGYEKVALYADADGDWRHAAKQLATGRWTSKIGECDDIEHKRPESLESDIYGRVHCLMRRKLPASESRETSSRFHWLRSLWTRLLRRP